MLRGLLIAATVPAALAGCAPRTATPPPAKPAYTVGLPYRQSGTWRYPAERFGGTETGLAARHTGMRIAADGEAWDDAQLLGSHPTLQLPAVVRATNLNTGISVTLRVIDRGPPAAGRVIGLSARAATLLGLAVQPIPVRIEIDGARSQALRDALQPAGTGLIATPQSSVIQETLPGAPGALRRSVPQPDATPPVDTQIQGGAQAGSPDPGQIWLRAGTFGQIGFARLQANRLVVVAPRIERSGTGRAETFTVRAGPYATAAAADTALDQAVSAGVTDARIVVE